MKNFSFHQDKMNLNFNYDKLQNNKEKNKNEEKEKIKDYDKKEKELIEKMKLSEEKERIQPEIIINSINEIRLPKELYDISYDILQNQ